MKWYLVLPLLLVCATSACGSESKRDTELQANNWTIDPVPTLEIGAVAGAPEYNLDLVAQALRLPDGSIAIASRRNGTISIFDGDGQFIRRFGGQGEGPGEFEYLASAWTTPDGRIGVYDADLRRVTRFELDGTIAGTLTLRPTSGRLDAPAGAFPDGTMAVTRIDVDAMDLGPVPAADPMVVMHFDTVGRETTELTRIGGLLRWQNDLASGVYPFSTRLMRTVAGDWLVLGNGGQPRFELILATNGERRTVEWDVESPPLDASHWSDLEAALLASSETIDRMRVEERMAAVPRDLPMPVYGALLADAPGNVWVKDYDPARDNLWTGGRPWGEGGLWRVFDIQGRQLASVPMPHDLVPLEIGVDYVLGLRRDELGVQYVRLHGLHR